MPKNLMEENNNNNVLLFLFLCICMCMCVFFMDFNISKEVLCVGDDNTIPAHNPLLYTFMYISKNIPKYTQNKRIGKVL